MLDRPTGSRRLFCFIGTSLFVTGLALLFTARPAAAQVGGAGPDSVPCFIQTEGGGSGLTASPPPNPGGADPIPLSVTFDPSCTYLPVSPDPTQTYLYQATWDFGDGTQANPDTVNVPAGGPTANAAAVLIPVSNVYPNEGNYTVKLTITIFVQSNTPGTVSLNATATVGSTVLTNVLPDTAQLAPGMTVTGVGIPAGTTVISTTANTVTLSAAATQSNTGTYTFKGLLPGVKTQQRFITGNVRIANTDYPPTAVLQMLSSPATGTLPYTLVVTPSASFDVDGYILWAAIDWGDGISQLITAPPAFYTSACPQPVPPPTPPAGFIAPSFNPLLPNTPPFSLCHTYTTPGNYRVTLSVIDNGRMKLGTVLPNVPAPNDPNNALTIIRTAQVSNTGYGTEPTPQIQFEPKLAQDFLDVQVPGNLVTTKGTFTLDFKKGNDDKLSLTITPNTFPPSVVDSTVSITIGSGATALVLPTFTTDKNGKFKNGKLSFAFNAHSKVITLKLTGQTLTTPFKVANSTVANGGVDVPVTITVNGSTTVATVVRFEYKAQAGVKGIGKNGHSISAVGQ